MEYAPLTTRTHQIVGDVIDLEPPTFLDLHAFPLRGAVLSAMRACEERGDADGARELLIELGVFDLVIPPLDSDHLFRGSPEKFAVHYGFDAGTPDHVARRTTETANPVLRVRHLEYLVDRMPPGREWAQRRRELAEAYRAYVEHARRHLPAGAVLGGGEFEDAVCRATILLSQRGVFTTGELSEWAHWLVGVAQFLHDFPWALDNRAAEDRAHRWPFAILRGLLNVPVSAIPDEDRAAAIQLLDSAYAWYSTQPLAETFTVGVAEVDAELRKHFGLPDTTERRVRRSFDAYLSRARLHQQTGSALLTQSFVRKARALAETHREMFTDQEIAELGRWEQNAIRAAVDGNEFKELKVTIKDIPRDAVDWSQDTPEDTVAQMVLTSVAAIPSSGEARSANDGTSDIRLHELFNSTVMAGDKVVGQTTTAEERRALATEQTLVLHGELTGRAVTTTVRSAKTKCGLTADHLVAPFIRLGVSESSARLLARGFERYLADDFISALHILVPQAESLLRDGLNRVGFDTTKFRGTGSGEGNRTDDLTFGALLRKRAPDGRSVEDVLGSDLWLYTNTIMASATGMNLRNDVAHGLIAAGACSGATVGVTVQLLYALGNALKLAGSSRAEDQSALETPSGNAPIARPASG